MLTNQNINKEVKLKFKKKVHRLKGRRCVITFKLLNLK